MVADGSLPLDNNGNDKDSVPEQENLQLFLGISSARRQTNEAYQDFLWRDGGTNRSDLWACKPAESFSSFC
jgi:hypothetical protein